MKQKLKNYSFWISVTGAVLLLVNNLGKIFGFNVDNQAVYSIVDGVCGVLVVFGVLTMNKSKKEDASTQTTDTLTLDANTQSQDEHIKDVQNQPLQNTSTKKSNK